MSIDSRDFEYLRDFLMKSSGLVVKPEKEYLLKSRLEPLARSRGMESISELVSSMKSAIALELRDTVTDAMTTNESLFFRDKTPFEHLDNIMLPYFLEQRKVRKRLRIWCAAASTGQEPYSIAMSLKEQGAKLAGWNFDILGTDISKTVLTKATAGQYTQFEVQRGLPIKLLLKYFTQQGENWVLNENVRRMVKYKESNLLENFANVGKFDIVFCRNVLIYFDLETKKKVLEKISLQMEPDSYLLLGAAETVMGICDKFEAVKGARGLYKFR
ncbi:MAG: protein-glutamate O-methyltransferase CheR [Rhizobiales bacterium]|nr:protein-glutamate O-methyltransferase CheR [Hyphomicrobiales bacterium]NRB14127.1 protein-glutamate O-methyltransferase CheR [Hyphomicrobiales bacterium]